MKPRMVIAAGVTAAALLAGGGTAQAATYDTAGCPDSAPVWNILYKLHFSDAQGRTIPADTLQAALNNAKDMVQKVGDFSECAVRMHMDVIEDAGVWTNDRSKPPNYDMVFLRHPAVGDEGYAGRTDYKWAVFPVGADDEPNPMLLMHEWLHAVVDFYSTPLGWPKDDVHGGCGREDYKALDPGWGCMVLPRYFADMMTGRVVENGQPKGLPREQWGLQGTPTHPRNADPKLSITYDTATRQVTLTGRSGPASVTISRLSGQTIRAIPTTLAAGQFARVPVGLLGAGSYNACLDTPASLEFRAGHVCTTFTAATDSGTAKKTSRRSARKLLKLRVRNGRVRLTASGALVGRDATVTFRKSRSGTRNTRPVRRVGRLRSRTVTLRIPRGYRRVSVHVNAFTKRGVRYSALNVTRRL